ncbi:MAG: hypothetical protein JSR73_06105 [Proteobacteria bacterium]|nr:hypothetical protein [Pseudomonadota bacterium]
MLLLAPRSDGGDGAGAAAPPPVLEALRWRPIGPFRGGRVLAVAGVPGEREHFYFGAVNGGVWESLDAGRTWQPRFDAQPVGSIGALAVAPGAPRTLYVGTGEADMRSSIAHGDGVYRSDDGGASWRHLGLDQTFQIGRILVDPRDPERVYVAALGHAYGPNPERGVFRSTDGGRHWQRVLHRDDDTGAIDLAFRPGDPRVIYAALWQTRRPPWSVYAPSNGPGSGLFRSDDGGDRWTPVTGHGLPDRVGRIGLAVAPTRPDRVYAVVDAADGGLYRSDDAGKSWNRVSSDARLWQRGWYFGGVTVDPRDADVVYVCNTALYRSEDGGRTFAPVKGAPGGDDYHVLWIDPADPARRMLGVDQGAVVSLNGGVSWSSWFNQPTAQLYHVATDQQFPYWVYGAQQDSGAAAVPSRTDSVDGINLTQFRELVAGGESDNIAPDPNDPDVLFGGRVDRFDRRTQQTRSVDPTLAYPDQYRATWTLPLVFSKADPRVLYFANQRLFRTSDGGNHWRVVSPDLTRTELSVPANLDPATAEDHNHVGDRRGVIYSIGPSPLAAADLWVGTDDGLVWRSEDDGGHWRTVTPSSLTPWSKVAVVEPSHFDRTRAYLAVDRHRLEDDRPYVYATRDGGASWSLRVAGLPAGEPVNVVREDPRRPGLLYAGTELGVYVSLDDGARWQPLRTGLPPTSVRDLEVHDADLVIATHGRGFWILDDVAPLRQWRGTPGAAGLWVADPTPAVRFRPSEFTGSPMPLDEPRAPNPTPGAALYYYVPAPAGDVTIRIEDAGGHRVREYSSAARPARAAAPDTAPEWTVAPEVPGTTAGLHRFVWDLHYAASAGRLAADPAAIGAWAPPGRYSLLITAGGHSEHRELELRPDPRARVEPAAYAQQFTAATHVDTLRGGIAAATHEATILHGELLRAAAVRDASVAADLRRAAEDLVRVTDLRPGADARAAARQEPVKLDGLRGLALEGERLARAVDGADGAPTEDAQTALAHFTDATERALASWAALCAGELAPLSGRLVAAGGVPLSLPPPR